MFQPEDVQIGAVNNAGFNQLNVQSDHCMFEGSHWRILAETDMKERLSFFSSHAIPAGSPLIVSIRIEDTFAYESNL